MSYKDTEKRCLKCGLTKPREDFSKCCSGSDGLQRYCKSCMAAYDKAYRAAHKEEIAAYKKEYDVENREKIAAYNAEHKEEIAAYAKKYHAEHKEEHAAYKKKYRAEHKEEIAARKKQYRAEHKEEIAAHKKQYNAEHKEEEAARTRKWQQENPEKRRATNALRRARKKMVPCENIDYLELLRACNYICAICGVKTDPTLSSTDPLYPNIDHIIPLEKDGHHMRYNVQCLCRKCNLSKGAQLVA